MYSSTMNEGGIIMSMTREEFKEALLEIMEEDETMKSTGNDYELIYVIDDIEVSGGFDYGLRGLDHNILKFKNVSWKDILKWGTVLVPETETYISDKRIQRFEDLGYEQLPLNDNHILHKGNVQEGYRPISESAKYFINKLEKISKPVISKKLINESTKHNKYSESITALNNNLARVMEDTSMNDIDKIYVSNQYASRIDKIRRLK